MTDYIIVWEYKISEGSRELFEIEYGATGAWCNLFSSSEGYLESELFRGTEDNIHFSEIS